MIDKDNLLAEIADQKLDVDKFVKLISADEILRAEIVKQLLTNQKIMVYYHCYYIVDKASQLQPGLFYQYWPEFALLLDHQNSYHRDIGLTIIANLTKVDQQDLFYDIFEDYFEHINDSKYMTAQCCVKNTAKIIKFKPALTDQIIELLLEIDLKTNYPERQLALLKYGVLEVFEQVYPKTQFKKKIASFIKTAVNSISPKTRKKASQLIKNLAL